MTTIRKAMTERDAYFNGCLDARVAYEKDCILGHFYDESYFPTTAHLEARNLGWMAFDLGIDEKNVPILLKCDQELVKLWKDGWICADEMRDMEECPECNNGTGNPCSIHG